METTAALAALEEIVGRDNVKSDPEDLAVYRVDGRLPRLAALPGSLDEAARLVRWASGSGWAVVPVGGGTQLALGGLPRRYDLALATRRLDRVLDRDTANLTVTVQAGVRFGRLQELLGQGASGAEPPDDAGGPDPDQDPGALSGGRGCFIPLSPPSPERATVGGVIAANASGPTRLLYGLPRDLVLGLRFVTPAGEIVSAGGKTVKNVSGFDVCKLMIGSLGTLGLIGEATLRLLPLPEKRQTEILTFGSLDRAVGFIDRLRTTSLLPAAVELMNALGFAALKTQGEVCPTGDGFAVAVALEGIDEAVERMAADCRKLSTETEAAGHETLRAEEHGHFWLHYSDLGARLAERFPAGIALRANYPVAAFKTVMTGLETAAADCGLTTALWIHAGSGVARAHLPLADEGGDAQQRITAFGARALEFMRGADGNLVVEQAGPAIKSQLQVWGLPPDSLRVMTAVKRRVDPNDLFSPGRFLGGI